MFIETDLSFDPSLSKKERKLLRTKRLILKSAYELFSKDGFHEVTVDSIAEYASLSKPTIYKFFESKESIYYALGAEFQKLITKNVNSVVDIEKNGLEMIKLIGKMLFDTVIKYPLIIDFIKQFNQYNKESEYFIEDFLINKTSSNTNYISEVILSNKVRIKNEDIKDYILLLDQYHTIWLKYIEKGFNDGSIFSSFTPNQLFLLITYLLRGFAEHITMQEKMLEVTGVQKKQIDKITVDMITYFLTDAKKAI